MKQKSDKKMCEGCKVCDPYSYKVEVDLFFLEQVKTAYMYLKDIAPKYFAEGWEELLDHYMSNVIKK